MDIPTTEPIELRAGDSIVWERELDDYSAADGWTLKYKLLWATGTAVAFSATGAGTLHSVTLTATATASYAAGTATLAGYVEKGSGGTLERVTIGTTLLTILPNLTAATTHDGRSANRIALDNARAALASYMAKGQAHVAEYDIAGRRMKFRDSQQIMDLIRYYEAEVAREERRARGVRGNRILAIG